MQRSDKRYARVVHCVHCLGDNGFAPTETECRIAEMHRRMPRAFLNVNDKKYSIKVLALQK